MAYRKQLLFQIAKHGELNDQFRRMLFNVVARNQDDHVKNIAFLMDKSGAWSLSPAFDVTYAYNPRGEWTARHQMSINGKTDAFTLEDFRAGARIAGLKRGRDREILMEVVEAVKKWPYFADTAGVLGKQRDQIAQTLRLDLGRNAGSTKKQRPPRSLSTARQRGVKYG